MHLVLLALAGATNLLALNTLLVQVSALVGVLLPLLVAVLQRQHWPGWLRTGIGLLAIVVASTVTAAAQHKLNLHDWAGSLLVVFLMTQASYLSVWKPAGVAPWIETKTSPAPPAKAKHRAGSN